MASNANHLPLYPNFDLFVASILCVYLLFSDLSSHG